MAEVFLARRSGAAPGVKPVVIKRMLPALCDRPEFVKMFANEARLAVRLRHPNIAKTYDLGEHHGDLFIAMEFVNGEDLAHVARAADKAKLAPLPHGVIARIVMDVCKALHHAHEAPDVHGKPLGIVHRDVSPQNILLTYDGQVKIIDFGVAKATALANETQAGVMKGKYAYMSPEQCKGEKIDARADLFAVGVVAWEMFAWKRLFKRAADYLTMAAVVGDKVPTIHPARREVPTEIDELLGRALAKARGNRPTSCQVFAAELERLADQKGWDTSPHTLAATMHQLFLDKIEAQRRAVEESHLKNIDQFLLTVDESTKITWMRTASTSSASASASAPASASGFPSASAIASAVGSASGSRPRPPEPSEPTRGTPPPLPPGMSPTEALDALARKYSTPEPFPATFSLQAPPPSPRTPADPTPPPIEPAAASPAPIQTIDLAAEAPPPPPLKKSGRGVMVVGGAAVLMALAAVIAFIWVRSPAAGEPSQGPNAAPPAATAPPPTDPGQKAGPAHIILRGQPDVKVYVDGKRRGETPLVLEDLKPGRPYVILLVAQGYKDGKLEIPPLQPGEERTLEVKLRK